MLDVKITSEMCIKPSSPTPPHLKTYHYSAFDQRADSLYIPYVFFYNGGNNNNNDDNNTTSRPDLETFIHEISSSLKRSLSDTLTFFYPFAAKYSSSTIECTDDGAHYAEARVVDPTCTLARYLAQDRYLYDDVCKDLKKLVPAVPIEQSPGSHMLLIQATFFPCGGLAIGLAFSHKIADAASIAFFLRAWAWAHAMPRHHGGGGDMMIADSCRYRPTSSAAAVFPPNEGLAETAAFQFPSPWFLRPRPVPGAMRRFVFSASAIANLKEKSKSAEVPHPSRVDAVTALLVKSILRAFKSRSDTPDGTTLIVRPVNLRTRAVINPPLPTNLFGNLTMEVSFPVQEKDDPVSSRLVSLLKGSVSKLDGELTRMGIQGSEGSDRLAELAREMEEKRNARRVIFCNSYSRLGFYEHDFGLGKPVWMACNCFDVDVACVNLVLVNDTTSGKGLEAWVLLGADDVAVLENDVELLSSVSAVDPSPLKLP